jgi:hypothetical protein
MHRYPLAFTPVIDCHRSIPGTHEPHAKLQIFPIQRRRHT